MDDPPMTSDDDRFYLPPDAKRRSLVEKTFNSLIGWKKRPQPWDRAVAGALVRHHLDVE